ncbi:MAG: alginate lyase family protein, partial [Blastocatellia bacterium]
MLNHPHRHFLCGSFGVPRVFLWLIVLAMSVAAQSPPRVYTYDPAALAQAKARLARGDKALAPALAALRREADQALTTGPFTVTAKTRVPPSGDRHDYLTLAPYWWPDPQKPDGLPYIRRDGETNPESKRDTDNPRLVAMANAVETL